MLMRCVTAHTTNAGTGADTIVPVGAVVDYDDHFYLEAPHMFEEVTATMFCHGGTCVRAATAAEEAKPVRGRGRS